MYIMQGKSLNTSNNTKLKSNSKTIQQQLYNIPKSMHIVNLNQQRGPLIFRRRPNNSINTKYHPKLKSKQNQRNLTFYSSEKFISRNTKKARASNEKLDESFFSDYKIKYGDNSAYRTLCIPQPPLQEQTLKQPEMYSFTKEADHKFNNHTIEPKIQEQRRQLTVKSQWKPRKTLSQLEKRSYLPNIREKKQKKAQLEKQENLKLEGWNNQASSYDYDRKLDIIDYTQICGQPLQARISRNPNHRNYIIS